MEVILAIETLVIVYLLYMIKQKKDSYERLLNEPSTVLENAKNEAGRIIEETNNKAAQLLQENKENAEKIINDALEDKSRINNEISFLLIERDKEKKLNEDFVRSNNILRSDISELREIVDENRNTIELQNERIKKIKKEIKRSKEVLQRYFVERQTEDTWFEILDDTLQRLEDLVPTIEVHLKSLEYDDLKKQVKENRGLIKKTLKKYESRYTTKQNKSIYQLMVIALQAELQNILLNLRYSNYEKSISLVKEIINKYFIIASNGNQTIRPTWVKFIGEIEILFKKAVELEYEFYVRQENIKEEQRALREQMKQEAQEMKALKEEQEKLLREENKFKIEIEENLKKLENEEDDERVKLLKNRISELELQLADLNNQKEQIINLQNGKAGYVYVISNLGSFGKNVFKIGMTRRLDPQDRVNELGSASVPFKFDVHSFIFSEDAVTLETKLHKELDERRVNKINLRKEFFNCSIDELELIVKRIQPTASFIKTMLAEQYRQTLSLDKQRLAMIEE